MGPGNDSSGGFHCGGSANTSAHFLTCSNCQIGDTSHWFSTAHVMHILQSVPLICPMGLRINSQKAMLDLAMDLSAREIAGKHDKILAFGTSNAK